jgi:four helix bundle protein
MRAKSPKPHRNLVAWQKSMDLVKAIYKLTQKFPDSEHYGLNAQLRGAALSVPSNIAEGAADRTPSQFANFVATAIGSLNEIDTQLELSLRLGFISEVEHSQISKLLDECLAITYGLKKSIQIKPKK